MTAKEKIIAKINSVMCKEIIKEGGVQYLIKMYEGTEMLPSKEEIQRVMFFGEGYFY